MVEFVNSSAKLIFLCNLRNDGRLTDILFVDPFESRFTVEFHIKIIHMRAASALTCRKRNLLKSF